MSAGGTINGLRAPGSEHVVAVLSDAFATATRWTMLGATAFLFLSLIGALPVHRSGRGR